MLSQCTSEQQGRIFRSSPEDLGGRDVPELRWRENYGGYVNIGA